MSVQRRDYQIGMKQQTYAAWQQGLQNVLDVLATGGGKSVIMSDIVLDHAQQGAIQCVMAHRNELVSQMSSHIGRDAVPHRIIGSDSTIAQIRRQHRALFNGECFVHPTARTSVVGVDTLIARQDELARWAHQHDLWLGDEAHHFLIGNKWGKAVEMMPNARGAGFTATPIRADGKGLGRPTLGGDGVFDIMNIGPSMRTLIGREYLSDYEIVCPKSDMHVGDEEVSANGDWSTQTLKKAAKKSHIVGDVVESYVRYALGRRTIVFATDVETAGDIAKKFNEWGIRAESLSAQTPVNVREKFIAEFKLGIITVLVNVDLFDEGFDVPACDVVIMARPTASLGKYRQMVGRALRYIPGKVALIIDMVSNVVRHGLPDKEIVWSLARRDKKAKQEKDPDEVDLTTCKSCTKPYVKFLIACPYCGAVKPLPEPRERTLEMVEGDLILLDRAALEKMRLAAATLENPADIGSRAAYVAGPAAGAGARKRQEEKIEAHAHLKEVIAQWAGCERERHKCSDREIQKKFYFATGMDVLTALDTTRPASEFNSLAETIKKWYHQ